MFKDALPESLANGGPQEIRSDSPSPPLAEVCAELHTRVESFLSRDLSHSEVLNSVQKQTRASLQVVKEALQRFDLQSLSLSYNGGKDCLVLLILFLAGLHDHFSSTQSGGQLPIPPSIPAIYAYPPDPFPLVTNFVESSAKFYHLDIEHIPTDPRPKNQSREKITIRDAFQRYMNAHPDIRAVFVGTRRTDPHGGSLTHFDPTDHGWPAFMRIHPVIDWRLGEIWAFLRETDILIPGITGVPQGHAGTKEGPWCGLYDDGFTSLGGYGDTRRNPLLKVNGKEEWRSAWEMKDDGDERLGRE